MPIQPYQIAPAPQAQDAQTIEPTVPSGQGAAFVKTVGGKRELFFKNDAGDVVQITSNGAVSGGGASLTGFEKSMINGAGQLVGPGLPVSMKSDGTYALADANTADGQQPVGITKTTAANGVAGTVALFGRNMPGILTGLGFTPGDTVFLDESLGGFTKNVSGFTGTSESIIKLGVAAAADGAVGVNATDLIMMRQVVLKT